MFVAGFHLSGKGNLSRLLILDGGDMMRVTVFHTEGGGFDWCINHRKGPEWGDTSCETEGEAMAALWEALASRGVVAWLS
jgi:hypothetical protein